MRMEMTFPGGLAVDAHFQGMTVRTDQPESAGGGGAGPAPFDLFLASVGSCAAFYALRFCQQREISTDELGVSLEAIRDATGKRFETLEIEVRLPPAFPDKYRQAIVRAIDQCAVKRHLVEPPAIEVRTVMLEDATAG